MSSSDGTSSISQKPILKVVEANTSSAHLNHIAECCARFHLMSPWANTDYDHNKVMNIVVNLIKSSEGVVLIHPKGFILGKVSELVFGKSKVLYEFAWWAEDQGISLLRAFEKKGEELGVSGIVMASLFYADQNNERYNKMFAKAGYAPRETFWYKEK